MLGSTVTESQTKLKISFFTCINHLSFLISLYVFYRIYRTNAILNIATFVLFRILLLGWMTRWLTIHRDDIPILLFTVGSLGLATIVGMNIVLFYRILVGDYIGPKKKSIENEATISVDDDNISEEDTATHVEYTEFMSQPTSVHKRRQTHHLTKDVNRIVEGALRLVE